MKMDVIITSASRLELLERTLDSFCKMVINPDGFNLHLHEDVVVGNESNKLTEWACDSKLFKSVVITNPPKRLGFAYRKMLDEVVESKYYLKWEDDWEVIRKIEILPLEKIFDENPKVNQIIFNKRINGDWKDGIGRLPTLEFSGQPLTVAPFFGFNPSMCRTAFVKPRYFPHEDERRTEPYLLGAPWPQPAEYRIEHIGTYFLGAGGSRESHYVNHLGGNLKRLRIWEGK